MPPDFSHQNLRGRNFKGQDLTGANFSHADIRGANFTNTVLKGANFTGATAGLTNLWFIGLSIFSLLIASTAGLTAELSGIAASSAMSPDFIQKVPIASVAIFATIPLFFFIVFRHGLLAASVAVIWIILLSWWLSWWLLNIFARDDNLDWAIAWSSTLLWAISWTWAGILNEAFIETSWIWTWTSVEVLVWVTFGALVAPASRILAWILAGIASWVLAAVGSYMAKQALSGNSQYVFVRSALNSAIAFGGTSFFRADLTDANFSQANLKNTNLNSAKLLHTCWFQVKNLDRTKVGDSILANGAVRDLLASHNGYKKSYVKADLRGANLAGVNLNQANLQWADLSESNLKQANLRHANLREILALGADFTGACLTGACIEAWNIDHTTKLDNVDCQCIYLMSDQQERRPSSGDFAPGEFTKLFQEVLSTVDLIFRNGVDWKAFVAAFQQVQVENEGIELAIQSIENKGDGVVVVRVSVPVDADKAKIHSEFNQNYEVALKALEAKYQAELQAKEGEIAIYREQSGNMWGVINSLANRPVSIINENKLMNNSPDQSRKINVGGNLDILGSTINLGEISGNVTNTIHQLQQTDRPHASELAELLTQLQTAIESDPDLSATDKTEALEQVSTLAKAGQNPQDGTLKKLASTAIKVIKGTVVALPATATLVEAVNKLLLMD